MTVSVKLEGKYTNHRGQKGRGVTCITRLRSLRKIHLQFRLWRLRPVFCHSSIFILRREGWLSRLRAAAGWQEFLAVKSSLGFCVTRMLFPRTFNTQCNILEYLFYSLVLLSYTREFILGLRSFTDICILFYNLVKRPMWGFFLGRENSLKHLRPSCHKCTLSWRTQISSPNIWICKEVLVFHGWIHGASNAENPW